MFEWISHNNTAYKLKILDYTYTSQPSINSALPLKISNLKLFFYTISIIITAGFLWLLSKWSSKKKAIFLYNVCTLQQATHFLIQQEELVSGSEIVKKIDKFDIRNRTNCISFSYHERVYLYYQQKQAFLPIRYQELGIHLDQLRRNIFQPYSKNLRFQLSQYYGPNIITLPIQTRIQVFVSQMLTPYEVFQTYAIILWIFQQYYIFSFILLIYALYTYWQTSSEVVENQAKLSKESYFQIQCKIIANQNDNIGAINLNDEAQIQKINESSLEKQNMNMISQKRNSSKNMQTLQQQREPQAQFVTRIIKKRNSELDYSRPKSLLDKKKIKVLDINSKQLVPGDILILHEGDIVPCDCILLKGEILIDQSYITGQKYLTRKVQLQNFTYRKQSQNNFTIFLGTRIAKIKSYKDQKQNLVFNSLQHSIANNELTMPNQIVCLVINTNYNTLRGKYLRAIRYQKKQPENFTKQTIYFIYILLGVTTLAYLSMIGIFNQGQSAFGMFITYLDLIFTCIPPTLPTLLSVGINFAQHRLKNYDVYCVLPSNILTGGKVETIVLEGHNALGRQYEVESMMIGTKNQRGFGQTYESVQKFYSYYEEGDLEISSSSLEQVNRKKQIKRGQVQFGEMFINALSVCHGLQYFEDRVEGKPVQKKIFKFSLGQFENQNVYKSKSHKIELEKKIYLKQNQNKMAVLVTAEKIKENEKVKSEVHVKEQMQHFSLLDEGDCGLIKEGSRNQIQKRQPKSEQIKVNRPRKLLFVKGNAEKLLNHCIQGTYPKNSFQYIVDMAEKGFRIICYAYIQVDQDIKSSNYYTKKIQQNKLVFLGFLVLKQIRYQDNIQAIKAFKKSNIKVLLVSQQRELQTTSIAILNKICDKNQVLLCSLSKGKNKIYSKGRIQWQSSLPDPLPEFVMEFQQFGKNSFVSLVSSLYEELFMRRDSQTHSNIFQKCIIFNQMQYRHQRNLYHQLQKRDHVSFAVGGGGIVSQCADLSMELERDQSSLLSSFHTKSKSLMTIFHCLRICRAGLATNFHVFSMMILFSLIQFTTVCLLYVHYQGISDFQMLYQDLFVTFPIFIALNMTKPSSKLSKQRPLSSFFDLKAIFSTLGQIILQFLAQLSFILYLQSYKQFQNQRQISHKNFIATGEFSQQTATVGSTFILSNYLYLGIVLSTSVSKPFRKPFYTNPYYTLILILLWIYNTLIVVYPAMIPDKIRKTGLISNEQQVAVLAMIIGNLMMVLMYLYENLLSWIWRKWKSRRQNMMFERSSPMIEMAYKH